MGSKLATKVWIALALTGCVGPVAEPGALGQSGGETGDAGPRSEAEHETPDATREPGVELQEAPTLDELWAMQPEPLGVVLPAEIVEGLEELGDPKKVVGKDGRVAVSNTQVQPYSTVTRLYPLFPTEARPGLCTGSFIGPDVVLTAAHCVYDAAAGGWAKSIRVVPAETPDANGKPTAPLGSTFGKRLFASTAYRNATDFWAREPNDYALIRVADALGNKVGMRKFGVLAGAKLNRFVQLVAYHSDLCAVKPCSPATSGFRMYTSSDQIREFLGTTLFNHYADSWPGSSGGPLVGDGTFFNTIFALHVAGMKVSSNTWNMGVMITPAIHANIVDWSGRKL